MSDASDISPEIMDNSSASCAPPQDRAQSVDRIPKKVPSLSEPIDSSLPGDNLVLPPGVHLPPSVTPQLLAGKPRRMLFELPPSSMNEALNEFDAAIQEKSSQIRSPAAYLVGVIKRHKTIQERFNIGGTAVSPQGDNLTDRVLNRLEKLVQSGFCTADELDMKVKMKMCLLPEQDALNAIDELNAVSRTEIRNFASYFMGIMNRYLKGERRSSHQGKRINNDRHRNGDHVYEPRERQLDCDDNRKNNSRYSHYGKGSESDDHKGGRDRKKFSSRKNNDRYQSSKDKHDRYRRRRSRSYSPSHSRSRSRSRSYERRRRRSRSHSRERDSQRSHKSHHDSRRSSHRESNSQYSSSSKSYGQNMVIPPPPPPPRQSIMNAPPSMLITPSMLMTQPLLPAHAQPQSLTPGRLHQPIQAAPHMQQLIPPLAQGPAVPYQQSTNDPKLHQVFSQSQNHCQPNQQLSIPPNLSHQQLQALQAILQGSNSQQSVGQLVSQSKPSGWSSSIQTQGQNQAQAERQYLPAQGNAPTWNVPNQAQNQPVDILGLADKAAQVLSKQYSSQVPPPASIPNSNFPLSSHLKIVLTEKDLPMMIQYAIQNLRVTGHIDATLDSALVQMLKSLPEQNALLSLETFSSCDVSKMRNKNAYLSGILKKELVKLGL